MSGGIRAQASQARQQAILDAALDLFLEKGVGATRLDEILARCGASVGSFYHHFNNKVDVAAALYLETTGSYQREFLKELRRHRDARGGIEAVVRHHVRWVGRSPKLATYLTHCREPEVAEVSEARAQELNAAFFAEVGAWLGRQVEEKRVRYLSPNLYYALWMGPANEFTRLWLASRRDSKDLARAEDVLARAAWETLRMPPLAAGSRLRRVEKE